uniref:hypothetical protein n=1 Tax=Roseburia hominis TaxID=301301 RepID=UPI001F300C8C
MIIAVIPTMKSILLICASQPVKTLNQTVCVKKAIGICSDKFLINRNIPEKTSAMAPSTADFVLGAANLIKEASL